MGLFFLVLFTLLKGSISSLEQESSCCVHFYKDNLGNRVTEYCNSQNDIKPIKLRKIASVNVTGDSGCCWSLANKYDEKQIVSFENKVVSPDEWTIGRVDSLERIDCQTGNPINRSKRETPWLNGSDSKAVELRGGKNEWEGNVFVSGKPICITRKRDRRLNKKVDTTLRRDYEGRIVCKELGFKGIELVTGKSFFGPISERNGLADFRCSGTETSLADCSHTTTSNCRGGALGVICRKGESGELPEIRGGLPAQVDGKGNPYLGLVYIFGRPVCGEDWTVDDGAVVCRQLGFNGVLRAGSKPSTQHEPSEYMMAMVKCKQTHKQLQECPYNMRYECQGEGY